MQNKILILGASGLLGVPLTEKLRLVGYTVKTVSRKSGKMDFYADISDKKQLNKIVDAVSPNIIINLVAITNVDWCEEHIDVAYSSHVSICRYLSEISEKYGTKIIHISTDHVYDLKNSKESDVAPKNIYALTKLMGELEFKKTNTTILRTNFFGKSQVNKRYSLVDIMFEKAKRHEPIILFNDVYFSPLSIATLCDLISTVISNWHPGIFNLGSKDGKSKAEFILSFFDGCNLKVNQIESKSIDSIKLEVKRPKDMRMDCFHFENTFNIELPFLDNEIKLVAREFNEKNI